MSASSPSVLGASTVRTSARSLRTVETAPLATAYPLVARWQRPRAEHGQPPGAQGHEVPRGQRAEATGTAGDDVHQVGVRSPRLARRRRRYQHRTVPYPVPDAD